MDLLGCLETKSSRHAERGETNLQETELLNAFWIVLLTFYFRCFLDILWGINLQCSLCSLEKVPLLVSSRMSHTSHMSHSAKSAERENSEVVKLSLCKTGRAFYTFSRSLQHLSHSAPTTCNLFSTATKHCRSRLDDQHDKQDRHETVLTIGCH